MMKVIIEIEKDEELEIVKKAFKGKSITIVRTQKERRRLLDAIFKKYKVKLPKNYKFNREDMQDGQVVDGNLSIINPFKA